MLAHFIAQSILRELALCNSIAQMGPPAPCSDICTSSVSPELLHGFARGLAPDAFLRNMTLLSINMKVIWRASLLKNCEQANQCNNSGETEEVIEFRKNFQFGSFTKY